MQFTYERVTESAIRTVEMLSIQAHVSPDEDRQRWRDSAYGAMRLWEEVVGGAAQTADRFRIQQLIEQMPGGSAPCEGDWHLTPVVRM